MWLSKNKKGFEITLIGSGNVAWHLGPALENAGHAVKEVYSRTRSNAVAMTKRLYDAKVANSLDFSESNSQIFIVSVSDKAIESISTEIILPADATLVHTSGSEPLITLNYAAAKHIGVFYPLQTFSKSRPINFENIPLCIEAEDKEGENILFQLGRSISENVYYVNSQDRKILHVGAVFACNFTNYLIGVSKDIMDKHNLNFDMLKPLIAETINKALDSDPSEVQTGPARRGDVQILNKHLEVLQSYRQYAEIYKMLSQNIIDKYH